MSGRRAAAGWRLLLFFVVLVVFTVGFSAAWTWLGVSALAGDSLAAGLVPLAAAVVAASWVMMSFVESSSPGALGLRVDRRALRELAVGMGVGGAIVGVVVAVMAGAGWLTWRGEPATALAWLAAGLGTAGTLGLAAFWEEAVFRGYSLQVLAEGLGPVPAVGITAVLFAVAHAANPGFAWVGFGNTVLAGILLGLLYWKTYSLAFVTGLHVAWNWTMGFAAELPVSGLRMDAPGYSAELDGPVLLTGGGYGPEGGVLLGLGTLAAITWACVSRRLERDPAVLALGPLPERKSGRKRPNDPNGTA